MKPYRANSRQDLPAGLRPLGKACQAMNFELVNDEPPVIVTMDHRAVLCAAWAAMKEGRFQSGNDSVPPLLVRWDAHPDLGEKPRPWAWEKSLMRDTDSVTAIANAQRYDDGGWVMSAMQFGLAGDVITGGVHEYHRFDGDDLPYDDHEDRCHSLQTFSSLPEQLDCVEKILERLPANYPVWFDIDLDFGTTRLDDDSVRLWSDEEWSRFLSEDSVKRWAAVMERSRLMTISLEPWFCGGVSECGQIVAVLKKRFADATDLLRRL